MKRTILHLATIIFMFSALCTKAQVLLFDQTGNPNGGTTAQDFETAYDQYDGQCADDFFVPTGVTWYIDSIKMFGSYSSGAALSGGVKMTLAHDNSAAIGSTIFDTTITTDMDPDDNGSLNMPFSNPYILTQGIYWVVGSARKDFAGGGGQWYWGREVSGYGTDFKWKNPGNGFATGCTNWTPANQCSALGVSDSALRFRIWGCYGPKPILSMPEDTTMCADDVPYTIGSSITQSGVTYYWNTGDTQQTITADTSGTYTLFAYNPTNQCISKARIQVTVAPNPHAQSLENDTICSGQTKTFNGFSGCSTCQYVWDGTTNGVFLITGDPGWHHLYITNTNTGCVGHDSVWLEVESTDPPEMSPDYEVGVCEGDSIYLSTVNTYNAYSWSTGATTQGIYVKLGGVYNVTVTTPGGCQGYSDTIYVTLQPAPEPEITWQYTSTWKVRLDATAGYQSYSWSTGATAASTIANTTGTYYVTVTDEFGCVGVDSLFVLVTGVEDMTDNDVILYPNPAKSEVTVVLPENWSPNTQLCVTDLSGRPMLQVTMNERKNIIDLTGLGAGNYFIRIASNNIAVMKRLAVE